MSAFVDILLSVGLVANAVTNWRTTQWLARLDRRVGRIEYRHFEALARQDDEREALG